MNACQIRSCSISLNSMCMKWNVAAILAKRSLIALLYEDVIRKISGRFNLSHSKRVPSRFFSLSLSLTASYYFISYHIISNIILQLSRRNKIVWLKVHCLKKIYIKQKISSFLIAFAFTKCAPITGYTWCMLSCRRDSRGDQPASRHAYTQQTCFRPVWCVRWETVLS